MWIPLDSADAVRDFLDRFGHFHDACLREIALASDTYVDEARAMVCAGHLDTSALLWFQRQSEHLAAIELRCDGITSFRMRPSGENCDSIIANATVDFRAEASRLAVFLVGGPLTGPPNSMMWLPDRPEDDPDIEVIAAKMAWRPVPDGLGNGRRYLAGAS